MKKITRFLSLAAVCCMALSVSAEEKNYQEYPHMFVGVQGGVQNTFDKFKDMKCKLTTPTASLSFGGYFNNVVGARLHFNGIWDKGAAYTVVGQEEKTFNYNYLTTSADALVNLCTLFGKKESYPVNVIFVGGLGGNYIWDNTEARALTVNEPIATINDIDTDKRWAFNGRLGVMLDIPVHKNISINLETDLNYIAPGKQAFVKDHLQLVTQAGVSIRFGHRHKAKEVEEEWATKIDTIWYDDAVFTPRVENGTASWNVHYLIRESDFEADEQLKAIGDFLKNHRECKVDIKSYADVQTGNPKINMEYSKQRCEKAVKALTDAGVPASSISSSYFGDTVQPFSENDKNRVSIIQATGLKDVNDKNMVKKFKTKEVRYRVD